MANDYTRIALQLQKYGTVQGLMRYINKESLKEQHEKQEKGKAVGIDKVTKEEYGENLEENIDNLIARMKRFAYKPQSSRRVYIPKEGSIKQRPISIPAYEDRLVQGNMAEILEVIYEPIFLNTSYGFRPGKSCHDAIERLDKIIMKQKVNYVVDADIKGFFENVDHEWLMKFLGKTIEDKTFLRYIKRFLNAGVMEGMKRYETDKGTPQGGLISPILANIYLHYVLDLWFKIKIQRNCTGGSYIVRYADDFVCCFEKEEEARDFYEKLKERLAKFRTRNSRREEQDNEVWKKVKRK